MSTAAATAKSPRPRRERNENEVIQGTGRETAPPRGGGDGAAQGASFTRGALAAADRRDGPQFPTVVRCLGRVRMLDAPYAPASQRTQWKSCDGNSNAAIARLDGFGFVPERGPMPTPHGIDINVLRARQRPPAACIPRIERDLNPSSTSVGNRRAHHWRAPCMAVRAGGQDRR